MLHLNDFKPLKVSEGCPVLGVYSGAESFSNSRSYKTHWARERRKKMHSFGGWGTLGKWQIFFSCVKILFRLMQYWWLLFFKLKRLRETLLCSDKKFGYTPAGLTRVVVLLPGDAPMRTEKSSCQYVSILKLLQLEVSRVVLFCLVFKTLLLPLYLVW